MEIGLKIIQKVIKDKYLVLAGDYFHIRAYFMIKKIDQYWVDRHGIYRYQDCYQKYK